MTLMEHLAELRNRLIKAAVAVGRGRVSACWILYPFILDFLLEPYCQDDSPSRTGSIPPCSVPTVAAICM